MRKNHINQLLICFTILNLIMVPIISMADDGRNDKEINEIKALGIQWIKLYRSTDIDKFMNQYTDNAIVALNGKPALNGKEAIKAYFKSRIGKRNVDMRLDYEKVSTTQNMAIVLAKFYLDYPNKNKIETFSGRSLIVYKKSKYGKWLIDVDIDQKTPDTN